MYFCLYRLIILMCVILLSLQQETTVTEPVTTSVTASLTKAVSPGETSVSAATEAPKNEPQSTSQTAGLSPAGGSQCQPHELLSENGCVDREVFLNQVVMRSWKDEGFEKGKEAIGVVDASKCKADEVKTPFGCEKAVVPKTRSQLRVPVQHSSLNVDQVRNSNYRRGSVRSDSVGKERIHKQKDIYSGPPINAHNRPRKNYILPGRKLRTARLCRPYEVLTKGGKCVRKEGKKGLYEHKNHVYGLQRRHRHRSSAQKAKEDPTTNKPELN